MSDDMEREIKIGLVLYGGVSLAVYEYGVTRCFHDLVRGRGVFGPLLEALESGAQVDVIAGTSAGGINGILLAAALESGRDIAEVADLWLKAGDLGELFRKDLGDDDGARSLLDGEGRYQRKLQDAFGLVCAPPDPTGPTKGWGSPGEIDLFVTGTDVAGYWTQHVDALGSVIEDKQHRIVFHLKHRPGRRMLGLPNDRSKKDDGIVAQQAAILASIARITSCFPAAFPPFQLSQIDDRHRMEVGKALEHLSGGKAFEASRELIDGGVLDNKPFGPVLRAVFYRMPTSLVDRKVFYVEPDPEPRPAPQAARTAESTPMSIAFSALSTIPSHESIHDDIEQILHHNLRITWLSQLKRDLHRSQRLVSDRMPGGLYHETRVEALARSLVLDEECVVSADASPEDRALRDWTIRAREILKRFPLDEIDPYDIDYQLRRAMDLLYTAYLALAQEAEPANGVTDATEWTSHDVVVAVGRIVKLLRIIRQLMFELREKIGLGAGGRGDRLELPTPELVLAKVRAFLDVEEWQELRSALEFPRDGRVTRSSYLRSELLGEVLDHHRARLDRVGEHEGRTRTILEEIADRLVAWRRTFGNATGPDPFADYDSAFYPLSFLSGIHELDPIELVRVSPLDAQLGLAKLDPHEKIAGDEVAHFSAFLRRDWRSNDILWGRIDGVERILLALLDRTARERMRGRIGAIAHAFADETKLAIAMPHCPAHRIKALREAWDGLLVHWRSPAAATPNPDPETVFIEALVLAAQEDAAGEELPKVFESLRYQELKWGRMQAGGEPDASEPPANPIPRAGTDASDAALELEARREAGEDVRRLESDAGETFRSMRIGGQLVANTVPHDVIGEYATRAYLLLWAMMQRSLGGAPGRLLRQRQARALLHTPARFANWLFWGIRNEPPLTMLIANVLPVLFLGATGVAFLLGRLDWTIAYGAALLLYLFVVAPRALGRRSRGWLKHVAIGLLFAMLLGGAAVVGSEAARLLPERVGELGWESVTRTRVEAALLAISFVAALYCLHRLGAAVDDADRARDVGKSIRVMRVLTFAATGEDVRHALGPERTNAAVRDAMVLAVHRDQLFTVSYGVLFASAGLVMGSIPGVATAALGVTAAVFDGLENRRVRQLVRDPLPATDDALRNPPRRLASLKWTFAGAAMLSLSIGVVRAAWRHWGG